MNWVIQNPTLRPSPVTLTYDHSQPERDETHSPSDTAWWLCARSGHFLTVQTSGPGRLHYIGKEQTGYVY